MRRKEEQSLSRAAPRPRVARTSGLDRLRTALKDAGVSEHRFAAVAVQALAELRPSSPTDPATQFSEPEFAALRSGGLDLAPARASEPDPVADTAARYAALLADSVDVAGAARILGVTPARVRQRAQERTLFALREGEAWRLPRAQFTDGTQVRGLAAVVGAFPTDLHPVAAWRFLTEPDPDLELDAGPVSPLAWLRTGGAADPVIAIAREL